MSKITCEGFTEPGRADCPGTPGRRGRPSISQGYGTLFHRGADGTLPILLTFSGIGDGAQPNTLIVGGDGNFYGTTAQGGTGSGTLFRLAPNGTFTTLAPLPALAGGSATPSSLLWGADGNLYGGLLASTSS